MTDDAFYAGLNSLTYFEIMGLAFHKMTGMLRPGKDVSSFANRPYTDEERETAFRTWLAEHGATVNATMRAFHDLRPEYFDD